MKEKDDLKSMSGIICMIPARYASSRFPGKMLAPLAGKTLIQHTYENACRCSLFEKVVVLTDDKRIYEHVRGFNGQVVMTSISCSTGTDRLVEAMQQYAQQFDNAHLIVNIQGDEPCVHPEVIEGVVQKLQSDPQAVMSTAAIKLTSVDDATSRSIVKCVMDKDGNALFFSRSLLGVGHSGEWKPGLPVFRHMGIYAYRRDFLFQYARLSKTPLQIAEDLEQLKVLEHGFGIKVAIVDHFSIGVDIPNDIIKVEQLLWKQSISS